MSCLCFSLNGTENLVSENSGAFLSVDILSVTDVQDQDDELVFLDLIDHPVITLADAPAGSAFKLFGS